MPGYAESAEPPGHGESHIVRALDNGHTHTRAPSLPAEAAADPAETDALRVSAVGAAARAFPSPWPASPPWSCAGFRFRRVF